VFVNWFLWAFCVRVFGVCNCSILFAPRRCMNEIGRVGQIVALLWLHTLYHDTERRDTRTPLLRSWGKGSRTLQLTEIQQKFPYYSAVQSGQSERCTHAQGDRGCTKAIGSMQVETTIGNNVRTKRLVSGREGRPRFPRTRLRTQERQGVHPTVLSEFGTTALVL